MLSNFSNKVEALAHNLGLTAFFKKVFSPNLHGAIKIYDIPRIEQLLSITPGSVNELDDYYSHLSMLCITCDPGKRMENLFMCL